MGRSLWIMDNVTPLQQIAAGIRNPRQPAARATAARRPRRPSRTKARQWPAAAARCRRSTSSSRARRFAIATPRAGGTAMPNIPPGGAHFDFWFQRAARGREDRGARSEGPGHSHVRRRARAAAEAAFRRCAARSADRAARPPPPRSGHAALHMGHALSGPVDGGRTERWSRWSDGCARQVQRASHGRQRHADAIVRTESRSARHGRWRHAGRPRRAGRVPAQGARCAQRRQTAAAVHRRGDEEGGGRHARPRGARRQPVRHHKFAHPLQGCGRGSWTCAASTRSRCSSASCRTSRAWSARRIRRSARTRSIATTI